MRNLPAPSCHSVDRGGFRRNWISILSDQRPIHHTSLAYYWICKYWQLYYFQGVLFFYWYIQPCWCEYMFISLSIIKIRKDSFDIVVWFPDMHCCQAKYLGGDIWHWNHPISERHLLFPYLRGSGYPPRRQIKSQNPVWFWITQDSQDEIEFISSKLWGCLRCLWLWWGEKKWKFSLWANSLAAEMKG